MRLSLIGPGDIEFHFGKLLKLDQVKFNFEIEKIAEALVKTGTELVFLPDRGISFEIATVFKEKEGKKLIAAYPKSDKTFGTSHLERYINATYKDKPLFDDFIDTENWYKHDMIKGLLGDSLLYLGSSPGTDGELNYAIYLLKLLKGGKEGLDIAGKFIHKEIRAKEDFTIFVYSPFLKGKKLRYETEEYIKKFNINFVYIKNPKQLENELIKLKYK